MVAFRKNSTQEHQARFTNMEARSQLFVTNPIACNSDGSVLARRVSTFPVAPLFSANYVATKGQHLTE